jgi:deoxyribose-phosphate aldolase
MRDVIKSNKELIYKIAALIDHTLVKANATYKDIIRICKEAKKYKFASVCVNPIYVSLCKKILRNTNVKVCSVVGFPLGATTTAIKVDEAKEAVKNGADEIDMVINIGALKSGDYKLVLDDIKSVREITRGKILKVIIETAYLTKKEKVKVCKLAEQAGVDFVKTSTGFGPTGATAEDVRLIKSVVGARIGVKAAGRIRTLEDVIKMLNAGATRIGTSASVSIVKDKQGKTQY